MCPVPLFWRHVIQGTGSKIRYLRWRVNHLWVFSSEIQRNLNRSTRGRRFLSRSGGHSVVERLTEHIQSHAKDTLRRLRNTRDLDSWRRQYCERVLAVYANEDNEKLLARPAGPRSKNLWGSYIYWARAMRSLAADDLVQAPKHLDTVLEYRVIYLPSYVWARALVTRWDVVDKTLSRDESAGVRKEGIVDE